MCYKDELQKKNAEKLQRKFEENHVPGFLRDYFIFLGSEAGKLNYWSTIHNFLLWCMDNHYIKKGKLSDITPEDMDKIMTVNIIAYLDEVIKKGISPSTMKTKQHILGSLWRYLVNDDYVKKNVVHNIPRTKFKIKRKNSAKLPAPEDMIRMIDNVKKKKEGFIRERNLIVIRVLKGTGIRESELAGLDLKDLHLEENRPYITVMGKGVYYSQDAENVLVSKDAKLALEDWLRIRNTITNIVDEEAVFLNRNGSRLSERNIQDIFKGYSGGKISPHMMRHLYATVLYEESGYDAAFVQEQLRHSDVNTTLGIYAASGRRSYEVLQNM